MKTASRPLPHLSLVGGMGAALAFALGVAMRSGVDLAIVAAAAIVAGGLAGLAWRRWRTDGEKRTPPSPTPDNLRWRAMLDALPAAVWLGDDAGRVTAVNERWRERFEDSRDPWIDRIHEHDRKSVRETWGAATGSFGVECRIRDKEAGYRWYAVEMRPWPIDDAASGWLGVAIDIERSRRVNESAGAGDQRLRRLADAAPIFIWTSDTAGTCTWFSEPWLAFTGLTLTEAVGDGWIHCVHPDDRFRCRGTLGASFDARKPFEREYRLRRRDGAYRWMLDRGIPTYDEEGSFVGFMGGCVDITERKAIEEDRESRLNVERTARAEAERVAILKDEFLSTVSHEMRTPLTAMLGWVQLIRRGNVPSDVLPQALETIERNASAQAQLIEELLDMSRILSGRLCLDAHPLDIVEVVEAAMATVEPAAAARRTEVHRRYDFADGPIVGDAVRLQQVFWILLNNAVKFTPPGGRVAVTVRSSVDAVEIAVMDNGEGIAADFLPHVFDRFRQQDASSRRRHQGLGLGLSKAKHIVELHGGSITAESAGPRKGATFRVRLPIQRPGAETASVYKRDRISEQSSGERISLIGTKVLLVEDEPDARELFRSILAQSGASVHTACSVEEAVKRFTDRRPDVLISDIGMPGTDGYELIRTIREIDRAAGRETPALALTAFARPSDRHRALLAGFQSHLSKPVVATDLVRAVARLCSDSPSKSRADDAVASPRPRRDSQAADASVWLSAQ